MSSTIAPKAPAPIIEESYLSGVRVVDSRQAI